MIRGRPYAWKVQITTNGNRRTAFCHGTLAEAAAIYEQFAGDLRGEFARVTSF
jgi:hypothetical protein